MRCLGRCWLSPSASSCSFFLWYCLFIQCFDSWHCWLSDRKGIHLVNNVVPLLMIPKTSLEDLWGTWHHLDLWKIDCLPVLTVGHFPGEPELAGVYWRWWVVTTGAISRAKLQSNHHQQTNIQFFYRPDALPVGQPTVSKHWRRRGLGLKNLNSRIQM